MVNILLTTRPPQPEVYADYFKIKILKQFSTIINNQLITPTINKSWNNLETGLNLVLFFESVLLPRAINNFNIGLNGGVISLLLF